MNNKHDNTGKVKPVKGWALVDGGGRIIEASMNKDSMDWGVHTAFVGPCIRVLITPL